MKVVNMDLFDVEEGILVHQVNTNGIMGAGIAKTFAEKYPRMERKYRSICFGHLHPEYLLGKVYTYHAGDLAIVNLFGQSLDKYAGKDRRTSYDATADGWKIVARRARSDRQVYVPYGIGCGLGGGDWDVYSAIVDSILPGVIACKID